MTDTSEPTAGTIIPAKVRAAIYLATAMLAAGYAVAEANTDLPWWVMALYAMWNAGAGVLAASNTPSNDLTLFQRQARAQEEAAINRMTRVVPDHGQEG